MEIAREQVQTIVGNINRLIKQRRMLKGDFYKAVGISSAAFSQWNVGATVPTIQTLMRVSEVLGVEVSEIMRDENGIKKEPIQMDGLSEQDREAIELIYQLSPDDKRRMVEFGRALLATEHEE